MPFLFASPQTLVGLTLFLAAVAMAGARRLVWPPGQWGRTAVGFYSGILFGAALVWLLGGMG
jgi:hypothetical protein